MAFTSPVRGLLTVTQGPHHYYVNGKLKQRQSALDLAPRYPWVKDWTIRAPHQGKVVKIVTEIPGRRDGYFVLQTPNGDTHYFVHCKIWNKIPLNFKTKQGGKLGEISKTPVNASAPHLHYYILDKSGRPVNLVAYYEKHGLPFSGWLRNPFKLLGLSY